MRTPWPIYVLEFAVLVGAVVLVGFAFGWGVGIGLLGLFAVSALAIWAVVRYSAKPS